MKEFILTEHQECVNFAAWLRFKGLKFSKLSQETWTPSYAQKNKQKAEGLYAGVPDYLIITPKGLVFLEMKRKKGGVVSPEQKAWHEALNNLPGVECKVCKGCDEAEAFVSQFL